MSTEYRGVIVVGYEQSDIEHNLDTMSVEGWADMDFTDRCEYLELERYSPWPDADADECVFGQSVIECGGYQHSEIDMLLVNQLALAAKKEMELNFGVSPKVYIMAQGW